MFSDELREFLKHPHLARMSTIDSKGYSHTVPVWYAIDGDEFVITVERISKKHGHIQVRPKGCITVGGSPEDGGGWLFKGQFTITDEDAWPWLEKMAYHYEPAEKAAENLKVWAEWDMAVIRMRPERCIRF